MAFDLNLNGTGHTVDADSQTPLLWVIREHLGLTGTKFGCGIGQCSAHARCKSMVRPFDPAAFPPPRLSEKESRRLKDSRRMAITRSR